MSWYIKFDISKPSFKWMASTRDLWFPIVKTDSWPPSFSNEYSKCSSNFKRLLSKKTLEEVFLMVDWIILQDITTGFLATTGHRYSQSWCVCVCRPRPKNNPDQSQLSTSVAYYDDIRPMFWNQTNASLFIFLYNDNKYGSLGHTLDVRQPF